MSDTYLNSPFAGLRSSITGSAYQDFINKTGIDPTTPQGWAILDNYQKHAEANHLDPLMFNSNGSITGNIAGFKNWYDKTYNNNNLDFGNMLGWANVGLQGVGTLANIWGGLQQLKLMKDSLALNKDAFNFNKNLATTNFNNSVSAQNDAVTTKNKAAAAQNTGATGSALDSIADTYHRPDLKTI